LTNICPSDFISTYLTEIWFNDGYSEYFFGEVDVVFLSRLFDMKSRGVGAFMANVDGVSAFLT